MSRYTRFFFSALTGISLLLALGTSCLGDVEIPPAAPSIFPVESPTRRPTQTISGEKPADCAVYLNGKKLIPADSQTNWSADWPLQVGDNAIDLFSQRPSGLQSVRHAHSLIVYEPNFPTQPILDEFASHTNVLHHELSGQKDKGTALILRTLDANGQISASLEFVAADDQTTWSASLELEEREGSQAFSLVAQDSRGQLSEPLDFTFIFDTTAAQMSEQSPSADESQVPQNSWVSLAFNEALNLNPTNPPSSAMRVFDEQNNQIAGDLSYQPLSHALVLQNLSMVSGHSYRVDVDSSKLVDLAGNIPSTHDDWSWNFSCGDASLVTPTTPSVELPAEVVSAGHAEQEMIHLHGNKSSNSSIWINDIAVVALDEQNTWQADWALEIGQNELIVRAKARTGLSGSSTTVHIERQLIRPAMPTLDPPAPTETDQDFVILEGQRPANTSIVIGDRVVVPRSPNTNWSYNQHLEPGANDIRIFTRDASGILSEALLVHIDYRQNFAGPVPADFRLLVDIDLRNLATVHPIASNLGGRTHYAVDAWLEGPLQAGESCQFNNDTKERQNIHYVATMVHYIGRKPGFTNPFWISDYRAPDYLAALVSGGVFTSAGINPEADRRDDNTGFRGGDLVDGSGRLRLSQSDLTQNIDGVTEATTMPGNKHIDWFPLRADGERLAQGEYLLFISLNLDRDAGWVASNDLETCWDSPADDHRGAHRIVQHLFLGAESFRQALPADSEKSGNDPENGADNLRYVGDDGVVIRWGNGI